MDARKLKEKATEAFTKGKFAKAGEAYAEYCAADPKDLQARLRMGDAWSKAGQKEKAIGAYQFAAEGFAKEGFLPRAIAASKLVLELDPSHKGVQKMLAELYARKTVPGPGSKPKTVPGLKVDIARPGEVKADDGAVPIEIEQSRPPPTKFVNDAKPIEIKDAPEEIPIEIEQSSSRLAAAAKSKAPAPMPPPEEIPIEIEQSKGPPPPSDISFDLEPEPSSAPMPEEIPIDIEQSLRMPAVKPAPPPPSEQSIELDVSVTGGGVPPLPPPATSPGEQSLVIGIEVEAPPVQLPPRTTSGAYELNLDPEPVTEIAAAPVEASSAPAPELTLEEAVAERPQESSASLKRTSSGAYELDLDDAPAEDSEEPVELTQLKPKIDEEALVSELTPGPVLPPLPPPPPDPPPVSNESRPSAPPGLKPKKSEPEAPLVAPEIAEPAKPAESAPRFWMPGANDAAPSAVRAAAPARGGGGTKTDLEKSLEAFSKFDDEVQIIENPDPSAPRPPAPSSHAHTFTELELEGDSLLHAVETAAAVGLEQRGQQAQAPVVEERMEALDEAKPEPGALPKIPLFSDLPEDAFIALFERCPLRRFEPTDMVIQQGTLGDSFFVICGGAVKVFRIDGEVRRDIATLTEGAFFGEMALLSGAARTASVEAAAEDTQLLEISAPILTDLSHKYPPVASALKKFCRQRLLTNVMNSSALFAPFSRSDRRTLVERFRARDVQKGDVLIKEGERSDGMYIVLSGEVEVRVGPSQVATLKEGDIFGEMSLLTKAPATATCAAARRTSLLRLPREDFDQIVLSHPQILVLVSELTDERRKQNAALASRAPKAGSEATPMV